MKLNLEYRRLRQQDESPPFPRTWYLSIPRTCAGVSYPWGEGPSHISYFLTIPKAGFTIEHGGSHDKIFKDGKYIDALPRHKEINDFTASRILKKLGIR